MHEWLLNRVDSLFDALLALAIIAAGAQLKRRFDAYRETRRTTPAVGTEPLFVPLEEGSPPTPADRVFEVAHHEIQVNGHTYKLPGFEASSEESAAGRNDPCWCGSGKQFKRCHGA